MSIKPYDYESILIGSVLKFGKDAASIVFPALTPDRFIYGSDGKLGKYDHRHIWAAIEKTYLVDRATVNIPNVLTNLQDKSDDLRLYLQALVGMVSDRYHVYELDVPTIKKFAEAVDKQGAAYSLMAKAATISTGIQEQEQFEREVQKITDIDDWANHQLSAFRNVVKVSTGGLQHISVATGSVRERWERLRRGEQIVYLPSGMPSLIGAGLFAAGNLT